MSRIFYYNHILFKIVDEEKEVNKKIKLHLGLKIEYLHNLVELHLCYAFHHQKV